MLPILLLACSPEVDDEAETWERWATAETDWRQMEATETLVLELTDELRHLNGSLLNLRLPDPRGRKLFADAVTLRDLAEAPPVTDTELASVNVHIEHWPVASDAKTVPRDDLALWRPLLGKVDYFEHASFKIVVGRFPDGSARRAFETRVKLSALAQGTSGRPLSVSAKQTLHWVRTPKDEWRIDGWQTDEVKVIAAESLLFEEVLDRAIDDPAALEAARDSIHQRFVVARIRDFERFVRPNVFFSMPATDRHPGLSVVDLDRDGFDDFYVMARWGKNQFFRNRGDGSFEEISAELGLDIRDHTSSAIFADFDNDGDFDLLLGRTLRRTAYLVNEDGRFIDRSESLVEGDLPFFASAVTAADHNGDGLLDVYISTYSGNPTNEDYERGVLSEHLKNYLPGNDLETLEDLVTAPDHQVYINHPGPPNALLTNLGGGRFEVSRDPVVRVFRSTYQSTWADYDRDGDPDIYLANDFAPNNLLRNDGDGRFVDVTAETNTADIGFGMGASWGDYDHDGYQDLYVSNMYSKAGNRILPSLRGVDSRLLNTPRGNSLLRNRPERFTKVSGYEAPDLQVEIAGWSWSGQFADVDNDTYLDVYALSGHYTAPDEVSIDRDT